MFRIRGRIMSIGSTQLTVGALRPWPRPLPWELFPRELKERPRPCAELLWIFWAWNAAGDGGVPCRDCKNNSWLSACVTKSRNRGVPCRDCKSRFYGPYCGGKSFIGRSQTTKKPMQLVNLNNRVTNCGELFTYRFESMTVIRNRRCTFRELTKRVTQWVDTFNRSITVGSLKYEPDIARSGEAENLSRCFFSQRRLQKNNGLLIDVSPCEGFRIRERFVVNSNGGWWCRRGTIDVP